LTAFANMDAWKKIGLPTIGLIRTVHSVNPNLSEKIPASSPTSPASYPLIREK
jgi:hypothetical protein